MAEQGAESSNQAPSMPLSVKINEKFACLSHPPSKPRFFKIHDRLRKQNKKAYEPEILSIGPYHRGKKNLLAMEEHKLRYLKSLLERSVGTSLQKPEELLQKMDDAMRERDLKKKARECYADTPRTLENDDEFVEMMLLDGCFIIELFFRHKEITPKDKNDSESEDEHDPELDPESGDEYDPELGEEHHDPESRDEYDPELGEEHHDPESRDEHDPPSGEGHDPIFDLVQPWGSIRRDLLLYENQLPFFILVRLVELIEPSLSEKQLSKMARFFFKKMRPLSQTKPSDSQCNITDMALRLFRDMLAIVRSVSKSSTIRSARQSPEVSRPLISKSSEVSESSATMPQGNTRSARQTQTHLLSLIHDSWFRTLSESESPGNESESAESESSENLGLEFIKCTTELVETGIKFKQAKEYTSLLDIKFNIRNGVMKIPPLSIDDTTECLFRNLIAYEQYLWGTDSKRVTDYCIFMDRLINSAKDAQELRHRGIINNWLGDDEVISKIFNNLGNNVYISPEFCYSQVFKDVNKYCKKRRKKWRAILMQKYFNSPWAILSLLAAIFLLLLTVIQTIFAILSYV